MQPPLKKDRYCANPGERGNVLFFIFLGIVLLGLLTWVLSHSGEQPDTTSAAARDAQVNMLLSQGALLADAVQQMVINGAHASELYTTNAANGLNTVTPGGTPPLGFADWDTAPHLHKIYHPYGGGVKYMSATGPDESDDTVAKNFRISKGSAVEGVGAQSGGAEVPDILFTATIANQDTCAQINKALRGSTAIPATADDLTFTNLVTDGTDTELNATTCPDCVGLRQSCITNSSGDEWGYYQALLPQG